MGEVKHIRHNNLGADKILITDTDLDGMGCAIIFLKCYPRGNVFFANHGYTDETVIEIAEEFPQADILITDLSVGQETADYLTRRGKIGLLDHHVTAKWLDEQYEWATVSDEGSATRMLYNMLSAWFNIQDLEPFVNIVHSWDSWGDQTYPSEEAIEYEMLFRFMGRKDFLRECLKDTNFPLQPEWSWLLDKLMEQYEQYYETTLAITQVHENPEYRVGIALADQYQSLMGHRLCEALDLEYIMIIDNRNGKASLRGRGNVDLSELARQVGGGGHRKAAGFRLGPDAVKMVQHIEGTQP